MTYLIIDKHGKQVCECADPMDAVMMVSFDETRTVVIRDPPIEPTTVNAKATDVTQLQLPQSEQQPFTP